MAINAVCLEPSVGFLHDFSDYQTKQSLAYDLQEPFRWLVDLAVIQAFESGALQLSGFYFTGDDCRYLFEVEAKQHFIDVIRERFNAGAHYRGRILKWDTVIEEKTNELGRFLIGKGVSTDFLNPAPKLEGGADCEVRARILALTVSKAKRPGIGKSTLHYLRRSARIGRTFRIYRKTQRKLELAI